jgi:glycine hydroxymethyltransferase
VSSGIRLGTPALTTRGLKENDLRTVADFIDRAITSKDDPAALEKIKAQVKDFAEKFPMPH